MYAGNPRQRLVHSDSDYNSFIDEDDDSYIGEKVNFENCHFETDHLSMTKKFNSAVISTTE